MKRGANHETQEPLWILAARGAARASALMIPFLAAGRFAWPRGWIFVIAFLATQGAAFVAILLTNPGLIRTRLKKLNPTRPFDRVFVTLYGFLAVTFLAIAGLDGGRYSWARLGEAWILPGLLLHLAGAALATGAALVNPYLTCTVETRGHTLVTRGLYRLIRHPMYAGRILSFLGWPLLLGSTWSYSAACAVVLLFVYRTAREDRALQNELAGYRAYCRRTPHRLIPGLW